MAEVRFWRESDLPDLMKMAAVTAWEITPPDDKPHTRFEIVAANAQGNLLSVLRSPFGTAVVADEGGRPVGYLLLGLQHHDKTGEPFGYAADIYVEPDYRRTGASRAMHELAEAYLRKIGIRRIQNWTHAHNPLGQKASERHGFTIVGMAMSKDLSAGQGRAE